MSHTGNNSLDAISNAGSAAPITSGTTETSFTTSPVLQKLSAGSKQRVTTPTKVMKAPVKTPVQAKFNAALSSKQLELVTCLKELRDAFEDPEKPTIRAGADFDWSEVLGSAEQIFTEYSNAMEEATRQQEALQKEVLVWQEGAYLYDGATITDRLEEAEQWSKSKEEYVRFTKKELQSTSDIIEGAISKLKDQRN